MRGELTTLNTWALALVRTLEARGCDAPTLARQAGLDPEQLHDPNGRAPLTGMSRLWRLGVEATGDPCLGLKVAAYVQPATFHCLGLALLASQDLQDAVLRSARFSRIVSNVADVRAEPYDGGLKLLVRWLADIPPVFEAIDLVMASTIKMWRLLGMDTGRLPSLSLNLCRPATPAMRREFEDYFQCPIQFEAEENAVLIPQEWVHQPLPMANAQLARQNDLVAMQYLARFEGNQVAEKVRAELITRLPAGEPARGDIASALNLSEKTLQRRLREEDTSFQQVLDELRRDLAQQYLREAPLSVCEITFRLGFSDQSSFTRAFRRWTGVAPGEYRTRQ